MAGFCVWLVSCDEQGLERCFCAGKITLDQHLLNFEYFLAAVGGEKNQNRYFDAGFREV